MCQKCVVEHSIKQFRKIHQLVELSTLRSEVQKEANDLSQELDLLMQTLQPEYNLVEQQRIGLQLLQRSQTILQQAVTNFFDELKHTFISLTSNHSNLTQKKILQEELEKIMFELNEYISTNDFQISEFFERDFKASIKKMRENVTQFIEKTKIEYKKPNLKINDKFTQDIPQLLSNYISITFEKNHMDKTEIRAPKPRQTLHFTMERNNSQRLERKMTLINPQNLAQSQILNHTYLQAITEQNLEDQLIQQFDQNEEIQKIVILEQSRIRYLHSLIDCQTLFIHDIQLKENQLISLPESAKIPENAQTLITSDLILYICGGIHNSNLSQKFYQFDNVHGLLQLPNLLEPVNHHSLIYIKGFIYVIGGKTQDGVTAKCWRFIVNTQLWEEFANLNEPRSHHSSCVFENEDQTFIYTFFGQGQGGILLDSIEKYSNLERRWQNILVKNMIPGFTTIRCCCIQLDEQKILIYGGYYKHLKNANKMITFNTQTATIDNLNQLNLPIGQLQGQPITINNSIYSLHNCPDQIVPKYSEFGDVLYILEINNNSCHIQDVINCRQLTLKKN
ncbi:unnamed protein product [Paramecium primaurelia]|uniref:Attractin/MKLN-like beta-propeller domain-containing protein n=1 Tax=Paramecium primaurelia TaxID=5886 RepID=A0A8S1MWS7_PARPR|nr:unnamed protein product [Paramecium primaurelia]